jgi:hypothetical protein
MRPKRLILVWFAVLTAAALCGCNFLLQKPFPTQTSVSRMTEPPVSATESAATATTKTATTTTTAAEPPGDELKTYRGLLDGYYELIAKREETTFPEEGQIGILEAISGYSRQAALDCVGYTVEDISGDGIPELLIGVVIEPDEKDNSVQLLYAVFTQVAGLPVYVLEGSARNAYFWLGEGRFLYRGSAGAAHFAFGTYLLSEHGETLTCEDFYFTDTQGDDFEKLDYYYNTSGDWDPALSQKLVITREAFEEIDLSLIQQVKSFDLTPFSAYKPATAGNGPVQVRPAEEVASEASRYDVFVADTQPESVKIAFTTDRNVSDFNVLKLELKEVGEDGRPDFSVTKLHQQDVLTPDCPLLVGLSFFGTVPHYGISYVDEDGQTRSFAVEQCGEDGSPVLTEF